MSLLEAGPWGMGYLRKLLARSVCHVEYNVQFTQLFTDLIFLFAILRQPLMEL
jgi:hypothetical protein